MTVRNNPHSAEFWGALEGEVTDCNLQWVQSTYIQFGMRPFISDVSRMQKECTNRIYFMSYEKNISKDSVFPLIDK